MIISVLQTLKCENVHIRFLADLNLNSNFVGDKTYKRLPQITKVYDEQV